MKFIINPKLQKKPQIPILFLLMSFQTVASVTLIPALPIIAYDFDISTSTTQMLISVYLFGITIGQLIYGPISNCFGRKIALYIGFTVTIIGIIIIIIGYFANYFKLLLLGRLLTALGACVGMVMNFTMIRDVFNVDISRRIISYTLMFSSIIPGITTAISGFLIENFNWISTVYFLLIYTILLFIISTYLPETCRYKDPVALKFFKVIRYYLKELQSYRLIIGAVLMGCNTAIIYIFSAISPFIVIEYMGYNSEQYGRLMIIPSLGMLLGSIFSIVYIKKISVHYGVVVGIFFILLSALFMVITYKLFGLFVWNLFSSMFTIYFGVAICYTSTSALTLKFASDSSNGSSIISFINCFVAVISIILIEVFDLTKDLFIPSIFTFIAIIMCILYLILSFLSRINIKN